MCHDGVPPGPPSASGCAGVGLMLTLHRASPVWATHAPQLWAAHSPHPQVLFSTETFAMGVNAPARTVVFQSLRCGHSLLLPGVSRAPLSSCCVLRFPCAPGFRCAAAGAVWTDSHQRLPPSLRTFLFAGSTMASHSATCCPGSTLRHADAAAGAAPCAPAQPRMRGRAQAASGPPCLPRCKHAFPWPLPTGNRKPLFVVARCLSWARRWRGGRGGAGWIQWVLWSSPAGMSCPKKWTSSAC